jgi:hypothetical protein
METDTRVPFSSLKVGDVFRTNLDFQKSRVRYAKIEPQQQTYNDGVWNAYNLSSKVKTFIPDERLVYNSGSLDTILQINGIDETLVWDPVKPPPETVLRYPPVIEDNNEV